jgi:small subunit ribosomal protein S21
MIKIDMSNEKSLDSALKKLKFKFSKTKVKEQLFERQQFTKPSVERREVLKKAKYKQELRSREEKGQ